MDQRLFSLSAIVCILIKYYVTFVRTLVLHHDSSNI